MEKFAIIGNNFPKVDSRQKAMGLAKFAADYSLPDMLWCKVVRSPYAHAKILNIDTSLAERLPGVKAVTTGKDFNGWKWGWGPASRDESPVAVNKVRYQFEAVAAVAAIDEDTAEEAAELIKIEYEELPGVYDPEEAMQDGAPKVHDYVENNISVEYHWDFGDVEKAFEESYIVREDRFRTSRALTGFLEPPASLAYYDPSGYITIKAAKQSPYFHYRHVADCFKLPLNKVRIIQPFIGGGFGGTKNDSVAGDFCAIMLSKKTGKPVKFVYNQEEVYTTCRRRHSMIIYNKMGVKKDGTLTAVQSRVIADGGAYTAIGPLTMNLAGNITTLPYKLPNYKYDCYRVFTNTPVGAAMRGHGATHTRFACEIQMDMIAEELGMDPVEIRMKNAIDNPKPGTIYETVNKVKLKTCGIKEAIKAVSEDNLWKEKDIKPKKEDYISWGYGISGAAYFSGARQRGHQSCSAIIRICEDGTVNLLTGATDCGQGSDTVLAMIAAEELGLRLEDIDVKRVDTAYTTVDPGTYGSRVTVLAGQATQKAAAAAKKQLLELYAKEKGIKPTDIEIREGEFYNRETKELLPFRKLAQVACYSGTGAVIIGTGYSDSGVDEDEWGLHTGRGGNATGFSFTAQAAKVGVDLETGKIKVEDFVIAHDCGRPLYPQSVEGQNEGGAIQGLGQAIYEDFIIDNKGKTLNPTLLDYKMPRSTDIPSMKLIDIITNDPDGIFGAKEASEGSIVSTPPAVISAIHDATGIWFTELPVTPEKIIKALKEKARK